MRDKLLSMTQGWDKAIVVTVCFIIIVNHFIYVFKSNQYPVWDEHHYINLAVRYYDILRQPSFDSYVKMLEVSSYRQPVYPFFLSIPLFLFGTLHTYKIALLQNGLLYIVTLLCVYFLSRKYMGKVASVMAVILAAFYGNSLFYLHFTYSETALTTGVMLSLTLLAYSEGLKKEVPTAFASIFIGITWLIKWAGLPFLLLPVIDTCIEGITKRNCKYQTFIKHLFVLITIGVLFPIFLFYLPNFSQFMDYVFKNQFEGIQWVQTYRSSELVNTLSVRSIMYYLNIISQNTIYFFILFSIGMIIAFIKFYKYHFLILSFISQYIFLTVFTVWKEDRFAVSLYPIIAIISAMVFEYLKIRFLKNMLIIITVCLSLLIFLGAMWGIGPMGQRGLLDYITPSWWPHPRRIYLTPLVWPPRDEYVNIHKLFERVKVDNEENPLVYQLFEFEPWDNAVYGELNYEQRQLFMHKYIKDTNELSSADVLSLMESIYILTKNEEIEEFFKRRNISLNEYTFSNFSIIEKITVPIDNSIVYVYKKND